MYKIRITFLFIYIFPIVSSGQLPIMPSSHICRTSINPSDFTTQKLELAFYGIYSNLNHSYYNGFSLRNLTNNQVIETQNVIFKDPNYTQYCVNTVWKGSNNDRVGIGLYYTNNDLNSLETINTAGITFALLKSIKNGRFNTGIGIKTNTMKFSKERAFHTFQPSEFVYIQDYSERLMNFDLGVTYINDTNCIKVAASIFNVKKRSYLVKTLDEKYRIFYSSNPVFTLSVVKDFILSKNCKINSSFLLLESNLNEEFYINTNFLLYRKWIGVGLQYNKALIGYFGPILSVLTNKIYFEYTMNIPLKNTSVLSGYHNIGLKLTVNNT